MSQIKTPSYLEECRKQIALGIPVFLAQIAMVSMGVVDIVMTGHFDDISLGRTGPMDMPAVALAASLWMPIILFGQGMLVSITPRVAFYRGAGQLHLFGHTVRQGIWLAILISIPLMSLIYIFSHILNSLGVTEPLATISGQYLRAILWGGPSYLIFVALRASLDGLARVRPAMLAGFAGLFINIPCNYVLIFGKFGFEPMGGVGAGIATAITYTTMAIILTLSALRMPDVRVALRIFEWPAWKECRELVRVGFPSALALLCEVSLFACVSLLLAPFGAIMIAGHQVALSFTSLIFMLPLAICMSVTVRIGYFRGIQDTAGIIQATRVAFALTLGTGVITALATLYFRYEIVSLYNQDITVIALASTLLLFAATYQCTDAMQIVAVGVLRGYNDTRAIFIITFITYWLIAMPLGFIFGRLNIWPPLHGAYGFWFAFVVGVTLAAFVYIIRIKHLERRLLLADTV